MANLSDHPEVPTASMIDASALRVGPFASDQAAVPGQQRARRDKPMGSQHGWQAPGQCRQDGTVGPARHS